MLENDTKRYNFAGFQVVFGLIASLAYLQTLISWLGYNRGPAIIALPAAAFIVLAWVSVIKNQHGFRVNWLSLWSAAIVGYLGLGITALVIIIVTSRPYDGGGANIGLGLLASGTPSLLPIFMLIGLSLSVITRRD
jgi:hypothetical protein